MTNRSIQHHIRFAPAKSMMAAAVMVAGFILPTAASADMDTISNGEIAHLSAVENSGYMEFYQHPELGSFEFTSIYIEPVANEMPERQIRDFRFRPEEIDELASEFHDKLRDSFATTGLLTDEPDENTLIISTSLTYVSEYREESTGSRLSSRQASYRDRGDTIMEMTWRAGPGGELVAALRDGRTPQIYAPVADREDKFTDARDMMSVWAIELASFFGGGEDAMTN